MGINNFHLIDRHYILAPGLHAKIYIQQLTLEARDGTGVNTLI